MAHKLMMVMHEIWHGGGEYVGRASCPKIPAELVSIALTLRFSCRQIDAGVLHLEHGERTALPVERRVIRLAAVIRRTLETQAAGIGERPIGVPQEPIYLNARERFIGHLSVPPWSRSSLCPRARIARKVARILPQI